MLQSQTSILSATEIDRILNNNGRTPIGVQSKCYDTTTSGWSVASMWSNCSCNKKLIVVNNANSTKFVAYMNNTPSANSSINMASDPYSFLVHFSGPTVTFGYPNSGYSNHFLYVPTRWLHISGAGDVLINDIGTSAPAWQGSSCQEWSSACNTTYLPNSTQISEIEYYCVN